MPTPCKQLTRKAPFKGTQRGILEKKFYIAGKLINNYIFRHFLAMLLVKVTKQKILKSEDCLDKKLAIRISDAEVLTTIFAEKHVQHLKPL